MIFIAFFIYFGICLELTLQKFDEYIHNSDTKPLFVAYTISDDSLSNIVENLAQRISKTKDLGLIVINILCDKFFDICSKYPSNKYPSFVLYRSKNPIFHVQYPGNYTYSELYLFLHKILLSPTKIINDQLQLFSESPQISPYSSFVFYQDEKTEKISSILQSYTLTLGNSFYSFQAQSSVFEVYHSPYYHEKYTGPFNISNMIDFIALHRYSIYHEYKYEDLFEYQPDKDIALVVSTRPLSDEHYETILHISTYFGSKFSYGYVNPFKDRRLNQTFETFSEDPPYFAYIDRKKNEMFKMLQPVTPSNVHRFLLNITRYKSDLEHKTQNEYIILFLSIILIISLFGIIRFHDRYQRFLKYLVEFSFQRQKGNINEEKYQYIIQKKKIPQDDYSFNQSNSHKSRESTDILNPHLNSNHVESMGNQTHYINEEKVNLPDDNESDKKERRKKKKKKRKIEKM